MTGKGHFYVISCLPCGHVSLQSIAVHALLCFVIGTWGDQHAEILVQRTAHIVLDVLLRPSSGCSAACQRVCTTRIDLIGGGGGVVVLWPTSFCLSILQNLLADCPPRSPARSLVTANHYSFSKYNTIPKDPLHGNVDYRNMPYSRFIVP